MYIQIYLEDISMTQHSDVHILCLLLFVRVLLGIIYIKMQNHTEECKEAIPDRSMHCITDMGIVLWQALK